MTRIDVIFQKVISNRYVQHLAFWIFSFSLLTYSFAQGNELGPIDWIYTGLFHISAVFVVYVNVLVLIPHILQKRKYLLYGVAALLLISVGVALNIWSFNVLAGLIFKNYYFISSLTIPGLLGILGSYLAVSTILKLSKSWIQLQRAETKLNRAKRNQQEAEMKALKNKIQPHFMLNSLNNIYAMSLQKDPRTPEFVMQLSETVRYLLHEADLEKVPLTSELDFLERYVSLQKVRMDFPETIDFNIQGKVDGQEIAPLLLLPIVENCFKHGLKGKASEAEIQIQIEIGEKELQLHATNKKSKNAESAFIESGIGLDNLKRRLRILYGHHFTLNIEDDMHRYQTDLKIPLS